MSITSCSKAPCSGVTNRVATNFLYTRQTNTNICVYGTLYVHHLLHLHTYVCTYVCRCSSPEYIYSETCTKDYLFIRTTYPKWPLLHHPVDISTTLRVPLYKDHLPAKSTSSWSSGWSPYTGSTGSIHVHQYKSPVCPITKHTLYPPPVPLTRQPHSPLVSSMACTLVHTNISVILHLQTGILGSQLSNNLCQGLFPLI